MPRPDYDVSSNAPDDVGPKEAEVEDGDKDQDEDEAEDDAPVRKGLSSRKKNFEETSEEED